MSDKIKTACFTGHRVLKLPKGCSNDKFVKTLREVIEGLILQGVNYFGCGGALGFDTIAATEVIALKDKYPNIALVMVLPCIAQTKGWSARDKEIYNDIIRQADKVVYTSEFYYYGCMHKRNRHLVDKSSFCIAYLTANRGGTYFTVNYARQNDIKIINVADML